MKPLIHLHRIAAVVMAAAMLAPLVRAQSAKPAPKFYAYCVEMGVPDVKPRPAR